VFVCVCVYTYIGISVPAQAQERAAQTWAVKNAVTAVRKVFDKFDLDRAMSKAYVHAQQTFNMSHAKDEDCDPRCLHTCKCTWEQVIAFSNVCVCVYTHTHTHAHTHAHTHTQTHTHAHTFRFAFHGLFQTLPLFQKIEARHRRARRMRSGSGRLPLRSLSPCTSKIAACLPRDCGRCVCV